MEVEPFGAGFDELYFRGVASQATVIGLEDGFGADPGIDFKH